MPPVGRWPSISLCFGPSRRRAAMNCVECALFPAQRNALQLMQSSRWFSRTLWLAKCGTCSRGFCSRRARSWSWCSSSGWSRARNARGNGPRAPSALRKCCPRLCCSRHSTRRPKSVARRGCLEARPLVTRSRRADSPERPPPMRYIICNLFAPLWNVYECECVTHGSAASRLHNAQSESDSLIRFICFERKLSHQCELNRSKIVSHELYFNLINGPSLA